MDLLKLQSLLQENGQPPYRYRQILKNLYSGRYHSFNDMSDLPKELRLILSELPISSVRFQKQNQSTGTTKALLSLTDNLTIETVLMDYGEWLTACVSTQVGCPMGCTFCATGKMGFKRNLTTDEIVDQVMYWNRVLYPRYIGRVVCMGMGEPFANWKNVKAAIDIINDKDKLNIGSRKISLFTAGLIEGIKNLADLNSQINLAVSLHSADQSKRQSIMPIAAKHSLAELQSACQYYTSKTRRQIFFEYAIIDKVNDTPDDIKKLIRFMKSDHLFFLNLIPLNPVGGSLVPSTSSTIRQIVNTLDKAGVSFTLRRTFGQDINAACGQLASTPHLTK